MTSGRQRHLAPQPEVDIRLIIHEAQNRWLRPAEVCEILHNYQLHNFKLNPVPPTTPPSGSLFLFDRKALRYFRKDGHNWRKKRDGKTVREAHERLKAGSVDVLHCYYAHGEDNPNFQRRAYWMLDPAHEHIVLVHYREVTEGNRCGIRNVHDYDRATASTSTMQFPQAASFGTTNMSSINSHSLASPETVDMHGPSHSPELEEAESAEPDELEEMAAEIGGGDHAGLQTSLLEQIADSPQMPITHRPSTEAPWQANFNNTASTTFRTSNGVGADPHISAAAFPPQREFKPVLSLQRPPQQLPQHVPSPNLTRSGPISSLSRIADMLDSPGPSPNTLSSSNALDLNGWSKLLEHDRGSSASSWRDMFTQSTTPESRRNFLHNAGLQSGPGQSPLGQGLSAVGAPPTPKGKGIADALSPKNLGRVPQSALEADLRNVSERIVLKEAEQKQHQAQRSRWQTGQSLQPDTSVTEVPSENRQVQSTQQMFVEPDTLSAVVGGARTQQQVWQEKPWQPPLQQAGVQSVNPYEQQGQFDPRHHLAGLRVAPPPPNQNTSLLPENTGNFSPTVESLIDDVRHDVENNDTEVIENLKKLGSFGKIDSFGKMDSFGRWMNTAYDISEIPTTSGSSGSLWNLGYNEEPLPGVPQHMDESLSPAVSFSEQKFNMVDFSPEWGSPGEDTKILITGSFVKPPRETNHKWCCMFGVVEVLAELIGEGSLRCKAPPQEPGTVPFYVTCGDRQACSQVREFEYRASTAQPRQLMGLNPAGAQSEADTWEELLLKIRLSRMLLGHESSISNREGNKVQKIDEKDDDPWRQLESVVLAQDRPMAEVKELLFQEVMRHKLEEWLQAKSSLEDGRGPRVLDDRGQGVPHFLAALGYDWSIPLVFTSPDVPINFRDDAGWTALHWAAKYGREKMVVDLLDNGAEPGLSSDPSRSCPRGETAADVAKAGDHGGIAAFLAERSLTERLSGMTLNDGNVILGEIDKMTADLEGEKMVAQLARRISIVRSIREQDDQEKLHVSLEAVRASAHKAALLQSAFRQYSFRRRAQLEAADSYDYGLTYAEMMNYSAARRIQQAYRGHNQKKAKQQLAAIRIQQKYRGWKGRKDFQAMRQRVIKIQAHVRGRLVRSKYQRIVWSVSIVEKVVLRWMRKRRGLRGFHPANGLEETADDIEDLTKDGREKQKVEVQKDVDKVYSMARQKSDREQYSRLVEESRRSASKAELNEALSGTSDYMERDL